MVKKFLESFSPLRVKLILHWIFVGILIDMDTEIGVRHK